VKLEDIWNKIKTILEEDTVLSPYIQVVYSGTRDNIPVNMFPCIILEPTNAPEEPVTMPHNTEINFTATIFGYIKIFEVDKQIVGDTTIKTISLGSGGIGYTAGDIITVVQTSGSLGTVTVNTVNGSGVILTVTLLNGGSGYVVADGLAVTGGSGNGATINILTINIIKGILDLNFDIKKALGAHIDLDGECLYFSFPNTRFDFSSYPFRGVEIDIKITLRQSFVTRE